MEAMQGMAQEDVLASNAFDYVASTSSSHPRPPTQAQFAEQVLQRQHVQMQHLHHQQQQLDNWLQRQELQQQREMDHGQVYQQQLDQRVAHHQSTGTATLQQIFDLVTSATKGSKEPAPPTAKYSYTKCAPGIYTGNRHGCQQTPTSVPNSICSPIPDGQAPTKRAGGTWQRCQ
ncbi:hypothetical protein CYMTET_34874 [Cymbomonas tetramitiformis]|uniref:Uncharacterized protein n=1 Tax=Cymbomonas tetramitiformis TaxID=36881 RepID=A0AAE0FAA2_9CHLO|nr:hypothetical protein CYMTET_34874 [Cymbomonas tetramitiformis]